MATGADLWAAAGRRMGCALALALVVAGCARIDRYHGFVPSEIEVAQLQVGATTRAEVIRLFGPPMADRAVETNTVYYAASQFRYFGPFAPEEVSREVLALNFDRRDRLRDISRYTLEDGRALVLNRQVTEDGINDVTFLGQLLGSLGRVDAATVLGDEP